MKANSVPLTAALAPILWGTTYLVTTELLPPDRPLLAGLLRALPAGVVLLLALAILRRRRALPRGDWWWRSVLLGSLNIGLFFPLLFTAAYRLPGGVAAVAGALGPFAVAGLAYVLLHQRVGRTVMIAAGVGVVGVGLLVLRSQVTLDPIGLLAAAAGTLSMSTGTVLGRRWGTPGHVGGRSSSLLALTGWQLTAGGLVLLPLTLLVEGAPPALSAPNVLGFGYLSLVGTALAYVAWFGGVTRLAPVKVSMLALLSPVVATALGWVVLGETLTLAQLVGAAAVVAAVVIGAAPRVAPERSGRCYSGPVSPDTASFSSSALIVTPDTGLPLAVPPSSASGSSPGPGASRGGAPPSLARATDDEASLAAARDSRLLRTSTGSGGSAVMPRHYKPHGVPPTSQLPRHGRVSVTDAGCRSGSSRWWPSPRLRPTARH